MKKIWETMNEEETFAVGKTLGENAKKGQVFALNGDLGVGKTVLTKGFAKGLAIEEHITSPTFAIMQIYEGRLPLYHFDVYRLSYEEELEDIGYEEYFYGEGVTLVEWANKFKELMPKDIIQITIEKSLEKGLDYRIITLENHQEEV
ncbi:MAG: tRNA (adenosine(37)-N6)-threonylcarbamoyltransferase complex ATPase subunit type 1 TsaE [Bacillota bacterium]